MKNYKVVLVCLICTFLFSCAKWKNEVASNGGILGSYNGKYIVINYSGGKIMDIWKLENSLVQNERNSDGWLFRDNNGNAVNIGGDAKVIRCNGKDSLWDKYDDFHYEFQNSEAERETK